jgi:hypothetical protein
MNPASTLLRSLGNPEWLKAQTIGAARWNAVVNGTAPATRTVIMSGPGGERLEAPATHTEQQVPYVTRQELEAILDLAWSHGLRPDRKLIQDALA